MPIALIVRLADRDRREGNPALESAARVMSNHIGRVLSVAVTAAWSEIVTRS